MIRALLADRATGQNVNKMARTFHETLIAMLAETVRRVAAQTGLNRVVLSGGCFANRLLIEGLLRRLQNKDLNVYTHNRVPTTDGGIALGQAVIAAERLRKRGHVDFSASAEKGVTLTFRSTPSCA
jgi:hydrogenase maturation protein HypF